MVQKAVPNLAIHLNREVNKGYEFNNQVDLLPLIGMSDDENEEFFMESLAKELGLTKEEILDFDLGIYCLEKGCTFGINEEFISAPRIDNISSVQACLTGILESNRKKGIDVIACFDHEEVGSRTKQGANSNLLSMLLEKIYEALNLNLKVKVL